MEWSAEAGDAWKGYRVRTEPPADDDPCDRFRARNQSGIQVVGGIGYFLGGQDRLDQLGSTIFGGSKSSIHGLFGDFAE